MPTEAVEERTSEVEVAVLRGVVEHRRLDEFEVELRAVAEQLPGAGLLR